MKDYIKQIIEILESESVPRGVYEDAVETIHRLTQENQRLMAKSVNLRDALRETRSMIDRGNVLVSDIERFLKLSVSQNPL